MKSYRVRETYARELGGIHALSGTDSAIYLAENDASAAIPYLQTASAAEPAASKPHEYMARAYAKLGNQTLAIQEQALAERLAKNASR